MLEDNAIPICKDNGCSERNYVMLVYIISIISAAGNFVCIYEFKNNDFENDNIYYPTIKPTQVSYAHALLNFLHYLH